MHDVPERPTDSIEFGSTPFGERLRDWLGFVPPGDEAKSAIGRLPNTQTHIPVRLRGSSITELAQPQGNSAAVTITCTDFSPDCSEVQRVPDINDFIARHRPEWAAVRWLNIDGLADMNVLGAFAVKYDLSPLVVEDVVHVGQRPKAEDYPNSGEHQARLFIIDRMLKLSDGHLIRGPGAASFRSKGIFSGA